MSDSLERNVEELRAEVARLEKRVRTLERREVRFGGALAGRTSLGVDAAAETHEAIPVGVQPSGAHAPPPVPVKAALPPVPDAPPPFPSAASPAPLATTAVPPPPMKVSAAAASALPLPLPQFGQPAGAPRAATPSEDLESTMGLTWVNRIGAVTLILAAGFVFKYAADNCWIGPWLRVLVGMLAGGAACAGAEWLVRRGHRVVAQGVAGLGIAIFYFSLFAAFQLFELLPQLAAFGLMAGVTVFGGALAVRYQSQALAMLAAVGGFLTPLMLSSGENRPWELNVYLLLLASGAIFLAMRERWQGLAWVAYFGAKVLYWASVIDDAGDTPYYPALVFGVLYYALFLVTPWRGIAAMAQVSFGFAMLTGGAWADISIWTWQLALPLAVGIAVAMVRKRAIEAVAAMFTAHMSAAFALAMMMGSSTEVLIPKDALGVGVLATLWLLFAVWALAAWMPRPGVLVETVAALFAINSLAFFGEGIALIHEAGWEAKGAFAFALAVLHLALSLPAMGGLFPAERAGVLRSFMQGLGVLFLACAIPLQWDGPVIACVWAGMGLALAWASSGKRIAWMEVFAYLLFFATIFRILAEDLRLLHADSVPFAHGVFFVTVLLGACMLGASWFWRATPHWGFAAVGGHAVVVLALITEAIRLGERSGGADRLILQTALISVILSIYAAGLVGIGVATRNRAYRIGGLAVLMLVVAKLYLFDVWLLNTVFRILAFGVLGSMLLATSFLYSKLKRTVQNLLSEGSSQGDGVAAALPGPPPPPGLA